MKENRTRKDSESENAKGVADDLIKKFFLWFIWMDEVNEKEVRRKSLSWTGRTAGGKEL